MSISKIEKFAFRRAAINLFRVMSASALAERTRNPNAKYLSDYGKFALLSLPKWQQLTDSQFEYKGEYRVNINNDESILDIIKSVFVTELWANYAQNWDSDKYLEVCDYGKKVIDKLSGKPDITKYDNLSPFEIELKARQLAGSAILSLQDGDADKGRMEIEEALQLAPEQLGIKTMAIAFYHNTQDNNAKKVLGSVTNEMILAAEDNIMEVLQFYEYAGRLLIDLDQKVKAAKLLKKALHIVKSEKYAQSKQFVTDAKINESETTIEDDINEVINLLKIAERNGSQDGS